MKIPILNVTDNKTFIINLSSNSQVRELKEKIEETLGIPNEYYKLVLNGRLLPDNFMLNKNNFIKGIPLLLYFLFR